MPLTHRRANGNSRAFLSSRLDYSGAVLAFLKRRWILLSCAVVLLACSVCDIVFLRPTPVFEWYGVESGAFFHMRAEVPINVKPSIRCKWHAPIFGNSPVWETTPVRHLGPVDNQFLPIWLPLSVVLGWLVFRELRWREKRAKAAESCETN
jgi:hypothetical protein